MSWGAQGMGRLQFPDSWRIFYYDSLDGEVRVPATNPRQLAASPRHR